MTVRFDDGAAEVLVDQLELTVRSLVQVADYLAQLAPKTTEDWHGRFRDSFDDDLRQHVNEAQRLAGDLHLVAVAVRAGQFEADATRLAELQQGVQGPVMIIPSGDGG